MSSNSRNSILNAVVLLFLAVSCTTPQKKENKPPNIVLIFMDDMGYGDPGVFGGLGYSTPNMDQLAKDGMTFRHFYSAQAVCSASRAGLLTGCYPNRIGISGALFPEHSIGLNPSEVTMAEMLKEKGYATAIYGKWHLGHLEKFLPQQHGFDEYVGIPYSNDMWPVDFAGKQITDTTSRRYKRFPQLPFVEGNETVREIRTLEDQAKLTTIYTEKAVDFINRKKDEPFFLYVPHTMPHVPIAVSDKFKGKSEIGLYGDLMMELDWSIGQIMKALESNGLDDNTLFIVTSDNGPWLKFGNHAGNRGGLREGKLSSWDGGQRVPCIMRWPGVIPSGSVCNKLASTIDFFPTVAGIVGGELPAHKIDGVDILPLLRGEKEANPRKTLYYYLWNNELQGVRKGNWKLVLPHEYISVTGHLPGNDGFPGPDSRVQIDSARLYNLRRDPGEQYDVSDLYPEKLGELQLVADAARTDLGDKLVGMKGTNVRPVGRVE